MTKKELLDRHAHNAEERVLLARVLDKAELARERAVPAHTAFLSAGERAAADALLQALGRVRYLFWGGYEQAERTICLFPPDWQEREDVKAQENGPLAAVEAALPAEAGLGHRDILGSLMGVGLKREKLGDILFPGEGRCQVVVERQALPILLTQWESAGRWKAAVGQIALSDLQPRPLQGKLFRDTVAALRLDAVLAAGFCLPRAKAADCVLAGRVAVNHRECLKADRQVGQGDILTCRGLGRCVVKEIQGQSKKGRIMLVLERYI